VAAIAIPRFSGGAERAAAAALAGNLAVLQHAAELYSAEHGGINPGQEPDGSASLDARDCFGRLVNRSTGAGVVSGAGIFGPYLRTWPTNPYNGKRTLRLNGAAAGASTHGWRFDSGTGLFESDASGTIVVYVKPNNKISDFNEGAALGAQAE
jgi:hypothetical protein